MVIVREPVVVYHRNRKMLMELGALWPIKGIRGRIEVPWEHFLPNTIILGNRSLGRL